jgi:hypothetical protein
MNDLLWLVNHPLWGTVMGLPTSWNTDTPEGLESRLFVEILWIPAELPHSTELELGRLRRTRMDSDRASMLELLRGLLTSQDVLYPSESHLSLYSTKNELGSTIGGWHLTLFTLSTRGSMVVFIEVVRRCCGQRLGMWGPLVWPADHATWPGDQVSSLHHLWALDTLSTTSSGHVDKTIFCKCANTWPAGQGDVASRPQLGSIEPVLYATSFPHVIFFVTIPYFGHIEDMHGFWSILCFSIIRCSWNGRSTKLMKLVSNNHLSSTS